MLQPRLRAFLLSLFLGFFLTFPLSGQDPDPKDLFGQGFDMMMEKKYDKALPVWERLLEERPESPHVHFYVGACLHRSSDRRLEGISHLEKAVKHAVPASDYRPKLKKDNVPMSAHYLLADLYHLDYQFEKAIKHYKIFRKKEKEKYVKKMPVPVGRKIAMCQVGIKLKKDPRKVRIENLGKKINSKYKEHSPVSNLDESTVYFTSRRLRKDSSNIDMKVPGTGQYKEDIYVAHKKNGEWQEAKMLDVSTEDHEATINLSKDGSRLYIYKDVNKNGDIYVSKRKKDGVTEPKRLGDHVNQKDSYEEHLDVSTDNQVLYFSSDRKGGEGGMDLYMVKKLPTGEWAAPQNLGPTINTKYDEDAPFIHPDGKTLYFSSDGHNTMGGHDIYKTQQNEDGTWQDPVNVGYPINSPDDDIYFVTTPDGKRAYYSSDFKGLELKKSGKLEGYGSTDIYLLHFPQAKKKKLTLLKGLIKPGSCEDLLSDIMILVEKKQTKELVQQLKPDPRDGDYVSILPPGNTYSITYLRKDKVFHTDEITVKAKSSYQEIRRAINLDTLNFDCSAGKVALAQKLDQKSGKNGGKGKKDGGSGEGSGKADQEGKKGGAEGKDVEALLPKPYKRYFGYNENELATRREKFSSFIDKTVKAIEASEKPLKFRIEASASKVPTSSFDNNKELARLRAENAKERLVKELSERGIPKKTYTFKEVGSKVQGPAYKGDFKEGKEKYADYQYVKIRVIQ